MIRMCRLILTLFLLFWINTGMSQNAIKMEFYGDGSNVLNKWLKKYTIEFILEDTIIVAEYNNDSICFSNASEAGKVMSYSRVGRSYVLVRLSRNKKIKYIMLEIEPNEITTSRASKQKLYYHLFGLKFSIKELYVQYYLPNSNIVTSYRKFNSPDIFLKHLKYIPYINRRE